MAISSVITVVPFQVGEQLNDYWKFRVYKIVICLKCQNLKKLQRMEKYKNWSHYYVKVHGTYERSCLYLLLNLHKLFYLLPKWILKYKVIIWHPSDCLKRYYGSVQE
jgi:hypothetical protein